MHFERILIAVDDSESAQKAAETGFALAKELSGEVLLVSVIDPAVTAGNPDAGIFPDDELAKAQDETQTFLDRLKDHYGKGVKTELSYSAGSPQETVVETAKKWQADLIVTGTHNGSGLNGLFSENTENSITHNSPVPVSVVPRGS